MPLALSAWYLWGGLFGLLWFRPEPEETCPHAISTRRRERASVGACSATYSGCLTASSSTRTTGVETRGWFSPRASSSRS
jgi:hypothetical protein